MGGLLAIQLGQLVVAYLSGDYVVVEAGFVENSKFERYWFKEDFLSVINERLGRQFPRHRSRPPQVDRDGKEVTVRVILRSDDGACAALSAVGDEVGGRVLERLEREPNGTGGAGPSGPNSSTAVVFKSCHVASYSWFKFFDAASALIFAVASGFWIYFKSDEVKSDEGTSYAGSGGGNRFSRRD
jgi:hypothetical protein